MSTRSAFVLTIHSRGTAIVPMSVPLTQALGAQIFFGSNGCARNVSRRNFGATARLAFQTVDRQQQRINNLNFPELASQSACRPPPTSLATSRQRQVPANSRAIPGSKIICYASLTTQSRGTAIVPMSVPLFPALGARFFVSRFHTPLNQNAEPASQVWRAVGYNFAVSKALAGQSPAN